MVWGKIFLILENILGEVEYAKMSDSQIRRFEKKIEKAMIKEKTLSKDVGFVEKLLKWMEKLTPNEVENMNPKQTRKVQWATRILRHAKKI